MGVRLEVHGGKRELAGGGCLAAQSFFDERNVVPGQSMAPKGGENTESLWILDRDAQPDRLRAKTWGRSRAGVR